MFRIVPTLNTGIKQTFGKFTSTCKPGLNFYIPFIQKISCVHNNIDNKTFSLNVKTKDNVFTDLSISVQLKIKEEDSEKAFFSLMNPDDQISSYVQNILRSEVPQMMLDDLFSSNTIGTTVKEKLEVKMKDYGWTIIDTLINDVAPDKKVQKSMNAINASERMKEAAKNEAEADFIRKVKSATADRDRKILQGEGISGQRLAILKGYEQGVDKMSSVLGLTPKEVVQFVLETQRLDMLENIGSSDNTKTLFLNHEKKDMRQSVLEAREVQNTE